MKRVQLVEYEGPGPLWEARVFFAWRPNGEGWSWRPIGCEFSAFTPPHEQQKLVQLLKLAGQDPRQRSEGVSDEDLDTGESPF